MKNNEMKTEFWEETLRPGKDEVDIFVVIGRVQVQTHDQPLARVEISYRDLDVSVQRVDNVLYVKVEQGDRRWKWWNGARPKAIVNVTIPAECAVRLKTITGRTTIQDVIAPVKADITTGKLHLSNLGGAVDAKTITGHIRYTGSLVEDQHRFVSTTGKVDLQLAGMPDAMLNAKTVTGRIRCDLPLAAAKEKRNFTSQSLHGRLGAGSGEIRVRVVTGSISVQHSEKQPVEKAPAAAAIEDEIRILKAEEKVVA